MNQDLINISVLIEIKLIIIPIIYNSNIQKVFDIIEFLNSPLGI